MKVLILVTCVSAFTAASSAPYSSELGLLTNYYYDCSASRGPYSAYVRKVVKRALAGDHVAMRAVIMHRGLFSTGDNEGYSEVLQALLRTVGDDRYVAFLMHQSRDVQEAALALGPEQIRGFDRRFPKTARLYHERFSR